MAAATYTTRQGDMWDMIAWRVYGNEMMADVLMKANPAHLGTLVFSGGVELKCPEVNASNSISLPAWRQ